MNNTSFIAQKNRLFNPIVTKAFFALVIAFNLFYVSCGLESFVFLEPIELVSVTGVNRADVSLPSQPSPADDYFRSYVIYYRIYLTDTYVPNFTSDPQRSMVNTYLAQHYSTLERYTTPNNSSASGIDGIFRSLNYYPLYVSDSGIIKASSDILRPPSYGNSSPPPFPPDNIVQLDFTDYQIPVLILYPYNAALTVSLPLNRAHNFTSTPDRLFNYTNDLATSSISPDENADVQQKTGTGVTLTAYVSMYIIATGIDTNYSPIYSRPTHIGIFNLPPP